MRVTVKKSKCSYKYNRARKSKGGHFKKGHVPNISTIAHSSCVENRVQNDVPTDSQTDLDTIVRLNNTMAADVLNACRDKDPAVLPFKLRPSKVAPSVPGNKGNMHGTNEVSENENLIVNRKQLKSIFQCIGQHSCEKSSIDYTITERKGLCADIQVTCDNCNFCTEEMPLYQSINKKHGKPLGLLNVSLLLPVLCSKMGISDLLLVLACLNIFGPDKRGMQRKLNIVADQVEEMGKQQLVTNQQYVRSISNLAGLSGETDIEFDASFTSRPQAGCGAATQVFAPVMEKTTTKHLPVDVNIATKLCSNPSCEHTDKSCKKNYPTDKSINQAEPSCLKQSLEKIQKQKIIKIKSVTTDGSPSLAKAMREHNMKVRRKVQHSKCFIHNMRNLHKGLRSATIQAPKGTDRLLFRKRLATSIRTRIRLELTRLRRLVRDDTQYLSRARAAVTNILDCFSGIHSGCRKKSVVCNGQVTGIKRSYLPYGKDIKLSAKDNTTLSKLIDKYCSEQQLKTTVQLYNTNRCENMHSRLFSLAPKSMVWSRSFTALCYSATLNASIGRGLSLLQVADRCGIIIKPSDPMYRYAMFAQSNAKYHMERKKDVKYKKNRYFSHRRRFYSAQLSNSLYKTKSSVANEHDYAYNLGK